MLISEGNRLDHAQRALLRAAIENHAGTIWVKRQDGKVVGQVLTRTEAADVWDPTPELWAFGLFVLPGYRRPGACFALVRAVLREAGELGARRIVAVVKSKRPGFYERIGFRRTASLYSLEVS